MFIVTFLMAFCNAKLKETGDKNLPPFRQFSIRKASDNFLPIRTLLLPWRSIHIVEYRYVWCCEVSHHIAHASCYHQSEFWRYTPYWVMAAPEGHRGTASCKRDGDMADAVMDSAWEEGGIDSCVGRGAMK